MRFPRRSGILLHPTSLPSRYGIGDFGDSAYQFIDFLVKAGQALWQVLPLGPTGYGDSPYQCFSAFAGNPLLISPEMLVRQGYLPTSALMHIPDFPESHVAYGDVIPYKNELYQKAFAHFQANATSQQEASYDQFCADNASWLDDFALFMGLKSHFKDIEGGVWNTWPTPIRDRKPKAMRSWREELGDTVDLHKFLQFVFFEQWLALKKYANENGISIIGDAPIFVAFDSADVWANRDLFYLDEAGQQTVVAGVPPDYFSETGQRWGNPLYKWATMKKNDYVWWAQRLEMIFTQVDVVRLDHFRGFEAYWEIPASEPTAMVGEWVKGPASDFFQAMLQALGELPIIAEDLGVITPEVEALREEFRFPGMKILQFAFGGEKNSNFLPHNFSPDCVVYTGTHDNETTLGWYNGSTLAEQDHFRRYMASDGHDVVWDMIRLALMSVANTAVTPMQDLMSLDNSARMNFPGKAAGYWQWRFRSPMLTEQILLRLYEVTELYGRLPEQDIEAE